MKKLNSSQELLVLQSVSSILGVQLAEVINTPYIELIALLVIKVKNDMIDVDDMVTKMMEIKGRF